MDSAILENIGFTKAEIRIYLALLELGNTTSGPIILKSKVARSKVYELLERLKEKGLVSETIQENTKYFQAASPERILNYIGQKELEMQNKKKEFQKILPQLIQKQKFIEEKSEVKVYVSFEGIKTFYAEVLHQLNEKDEYLAFTFGDEAINTRSIILMFQKFHQKRAEKNIKAKILAHVDDKLSQEKIDFSNTGSYEFRTTQQEFPTGIVIANDVVATFNWGKTPRVFAIICRENAGHYRKFFYSLWERATTHSKAGII